MFIDLPGVRLWYEDSGAGGVPVVFMHAATGTSASWLAYQWPAFSGAGYRCVAYDRRGWGRTETAGEDRGTVAGDLMALADALGLDRFHVVGTAAGGFGALDAAVSFPQRLRSVVVACSMGGVQDESFQEVTRRIRPPGFADLPAEFREVGPSYRAANPEGTQRWLEIDHAAQRQPREPAQPLRQRLSLQLLETIRVPALMLAGDADLIAPPALMRLLSARIAGCRLETVPEAGHAAFWEQPDVWNRLVLEFIARL
ncbi:MAG: alpha/beta hydrolase [Chloroflexi bacterium]|nr:alpha/beta hydrolase [Chloroflexota bacterium]